MSRKISEDSTQAFIKGRNFKRGNMEVVAEPGLVKMLLHGNKIAECYKIQNAEWVLTISDCGWVTDTTRERLNCLLHNIGLGDYRVYKRQGEFFSYGSRKEFPGKQVFIKSAGSNDFVLKGA